MTDRWHYTIIRTIKDGHIKILPDIRSSSPWKKQSPSLNKLEFSLSYIVLCVWLKCIFPISLPSILGKEHGLYLNKLESFLSKHSLMVALGKERALHLNKLESPSSKDALCPVWLKLAWWSWRRKFWNFVNVFSLFHYYSPPWKGAWPFI